MADSSENLLIIPSQSDFDSKPRVVTLFGQITEELSANCIMHMYSLKEDAKEINEDESEILKPFQIIVSSEGGNVEDMFSIYDVMTEIKSFGIDIETFGVGKVMSAATLLLAAGTKGKRKIGKNCSIMLHSVSAGHFGSLAEIENETKQIKRVQDKYVKMLIKETNFSEKKIKSILRKKTDHYLTAEEALEMGMVDIII